MWVSGVILERRYLVFRRPGGDGIWGSQQEPPHPPVASKTLGQFLCGLGQTAPRRLAQSESRCEPASPHHAVFKRRLFAASSPRSRSVKRTPPVGPESEANLRERFLREMGSATPFYQLFDLMPNVSFFAKDRNFRLVCASRSFLERFGFTTKPR
jgi:hypothetical protein